MSFMPRAIIRSKRPGAGVSSTLTVLTAITNSANATLDSIFTSPSYLEHSGSNGAVGTNIATKLTGTEISSFSFYGGAVDNTTFVQGATLSWTGATGGNGTIPAGNDSAIWRSANCVQNVESGVQATVSIGTGVSKLRVYFGGFGPGGCKIRVTLNDGSGLSSVQGATGGVCVALSKFVDWTLNANAAGQTATIQIFANDITQAGAQVAYGANVLGT